jgi:hypothetical protein
MNRNIEEILKEIGGEDVPAEVHKIAEETSGKFNKTLMQSRKNVLWQSITKSRITKLAVAAVIVIAVLVGVYRFGGSIDGTSVAFADVLEQIYKARTVTYKETFYPGTEREFTVEDMRMEPGYLRSEMSHGDITIWDFSGGKDLHLMPGLKKAVLTQRIGRSRGKRLFNYLDWISKLHEKDGEFIGQEEIDGQIADVFLVQKEFERTTIWVDPETNLPVRVEMVDFPQLDKNIIVPHMSLSIRDFGGGSKPYTNEQGDTVRVSGMQTWMNRCLVWSCLRDTLLKKSSLT